MLSDLLKKAGSDLSLTMLEVGALPIDSKSEPFHALLGQWPGSKIVAFEAEAGLCIELNRKAPPGIHYYPAAVAKSRGTRAFFETLHPMCSSLYPPDERWADVFHNLDVLRLRQTSSIDTVPLDDFLAEQAIGPVDFIKMDIQGAELEALQGAAKALESVLVIVCEVEFVPLYEGQPLFGEVDTFLRSRGFVFHKFLGGAGRTVKPVVFKNDANHLNQQMWADALFIRNLFQLEALSPEQLQKMALFLSLYGSPDVAHFLLREHDRRTGTTLSEQYLGALTHPPLPGASQQKVPKTALEMVDGVKVVVPNSLDLITTYVLSEQQDWFEDEIKFLRKVLQPGQKVVDIGANYGVYTLSMAKTIGPTGRVWAFEPATETAHFLSESIAANQFTNIVLEQSALSKEVGTARLSLNANSELNTLTPDSALEEGSEIVRLVTLDASMQMNAWPDIDFLKMDAEGEESNILKGGQAFFERQSPLIQYEIRAGETVHLELVREFSALGYESYRLVPGLQVLVPFEIESVQDGCLLNLFCCKPDRAKLLSERGLLINAELQLPAHHEVEIPAASDEIGSPAFADDWLSQLGSLPYGAKLLGQWMESRSAGMAPEVEEALSHYVMSQDSSIPMATRFHSLENSLRLLKSLCERDPSHMRLACLARVTQEFGHRGTAVNALQHLLDGIIQVNHVDLSEPFLAPGKRFDHLPVGPSTRDWTLAAILEEFERLGSYSSYYTGTEALRRLEMIRDLGFGSPEMARRLALMQQRFGLPTAGPQPPTGPPVRTPFPPSVELADTRHGRMLVPTKPANRLPSNTRTMGVSSEEYGLYGQFVGTGAIALEVGAGIGLRTVPLAQLAGAGGVVVAFEPQSSLLRVLQANLVLNSIPNVVTYAMALGSITGECQVLAPSDFGPDDINEGGEVAPLGRLDDFQLDRVDFIRLHAGGDEAAILEGAAETIKRCRPIMYINNEHLEKSSHLIQLLFELGYRLWWHTPPRVKAGGGWSDSEAGSYGGCSINMLAIHGDMRPVSGLQAITSARDRCL